MCVQCGYIYICVRIVVVLSFCFCYVALSFNWKSNNNNKQTNKKKHVYKILMATDVIENKSANKHNSFLYAFRIRILFHFNWTFDVILINLYFLAFFWLHSFDYTENCIEALHELTLPIRILWTIILFNMILLHTMPIWCSLFYKSCNQPSNQHMQHLFESKRK